MASQEATQPFHWRYGELDDKNFQVHGRSVLVLLIVFSVLLFFTLLCLYVRWACRYRERAVFVVADRQVSSGTDLTRSLGLDPATINSFPVHLHRMSTSEEAQCSICLSSLVEGEKVKVLPNCSHSFHPECVDAWLRTRSSCPLCRGSLVGGAGVELVNVV